MVYFDRLSQSDERVFLVSKMVMRPFVLVVCCVGALLLAGCVPESVRPDGAGSPAVPAGSAGSGPEQASPGQPVSTLDYANNVYFTLRESAINDLGRETLARHAEKLKANPALQVTLIGHSDFLGSRAYDLAISEKRVEAVFEILRAAGVPKKQIRRMPLGIEKTDSARCQSDVCQQALRRVELSYGKPGIGRTKK